MVGSRENDAVRTVVVRSEGGSQETAAVLQGAVLTVLLGIVLAGAGRGEGGPDVPLGAHQVLFQDQPSEIQLMDRELLAALEDAIRLRTPQDEWPSVDALAKEFVSPFLRGTAPTHDWQLRRKLGIINYIGRSAAGSGRPSYLLLLQENLPHPGNTPIDEFHRKMNDGTLLHVGVWFHPEPKRADEVLWAPEREGWKEIVLGSVPR